MTLDKGSLEVLRALYRERDDCDTLRVSELTGIGNSISDILDSLVQDGLVIKEIHDIKTPLTEIARRESKYRISPKGRDFIQHHFETLVHRRLPIILSIIAIAISILCNLDKITAGLKFVQELLTR